MDAWSAALGVPSLSLICGMKWAFRSMGHSLKAWMEQKHMLNKGNCQASESQPTNLWDGSHACMAGPVCSTVRSSPRAVQATYTARLG